MQVNVDELFSSQAMDTSQLNEQENLVQTELDMYSLSDDSQQTAINNGIIYSESESCDDNIVEEERDQDMSSSISETPSSSASCSNSSDSMTPPSSGHTNGQVQKINKPTHSFNEKWLKDYLMCPIGDAMQCIVCGMIMKSLKTSTIK